MELLVLPKDTYPFERVRLNQLFMTCFATGIDHVHWIAFKKKNNAKNKNGNNHFHFLEYPRCNGNIAHVVSRLRAWRKMFIALKVMKNSNIDIILSNDGIIEGFIGLLLARTKRKKFALYLSSLFFDMELNEFRSRPSLNSLIKTIIYRIKQPFYSFLVLNADFFHPISEAMGRYYFKKGKRSKDIFPLPLCPAKPMLDSEPLRRSKPASMVELVYLGQITPVRRIGFLIDIAHELKKASPLPFRIRIIGRTYRESFKEELSRRIRERSLQDEVEILDEVPFDEVIPIIDSSDIGLSILPPILAYRVSSPTKVVEYLSRAVPVIGNREIEDQKMVIELSGGGLSPKYDLAEIVGSIQFFFNNMEKSRDMGLKGRDWVRAHRNYKKMAADLRSFYLKQIESNGRSL